MYSARILRTVQLPRISATRSRGRRNMRGAAVRKRLLRRECPLMHHLPSAFSAPRMLTECARFPELIQPRPEATLSLALECHHQARPNEPSSLDSLRHRASCVARNRFS